MADQFENGYALLIGVHKNYVPVLALPDILKDIRAVGNILTHPERCAYPPDNIETLTGEQATRQNILDALGQLQKRIKLDRSGHSTAIVYYTGHGVRDRDGDSAAYYLIPYDMRKGKYRARALPAHDFTEAIGALQPERLLVVLDCCHAGGMNVKDVLQEDFTFTAAPPGVLMAEEGSTTPTMAKNLDSLKRGSGRAVLSSSQGEQPSFIRKDRAMSIFTYHLIEALIGHAQPQDGATEVLVSDVMSYVYRKVPESVRTDWREIQTPDYRVIGNFPIALLLGGKGLKGRPAPDLWTEITDAGNVVLSQMIDTGGGAFVGGNVNTEGGDFIGRDKIDRASGA